MDEIVAVLLIDETTGLPIGIYRDPEELAKSVPIFPEEGFWDAKSCVTITRTTLNKIQELQMDT